MRVLFETVDRFQKDVDQELNSLYQKEEKALSKSLRPVATELDRLVSLGVKLHDGNLFDYHVLQKGPNKGGLEILTETPCFVIAQSREGQAPFSFRRYWGTESPGENDAYELYNKTYNSVEELLVGLAEYIGAFVGDLGKADKSIYSKNAQDTIGID